MSAPVLQMSGVCKRFTLHNQHGIELPVLEHVNLTVSSGECVVLNGPSGMGKSTLLKLAYANYRASLGSIRVRDDAGDSIEVTTANPQTLLRLREHSINYVSQFLRVIPRVAAIDVVAEPLMRDAAGNSHADAAARDAARGMLARLRIPERLWHLPPATFSGGEQQRINIARSLIKPKPLLLLDEPTASLDAANTQTVVDMIAEARAQGAAIIGIFHDSTVGDLVATRRVDMTEFSPRIVSPQPSIAL
jgi:alpha-D-ribose 1-methylphosphonate 5-triphosphate synthase subunit PhnL